MFEEEFGQDSAKKTVVWLFCVEIGPRLRNLRGGIRCRRQQVPSETRDLDDSGHGPINTGFYYSRLKSCVGLLFTELLKLGCEQYWVLVVGNMSAHSDYSPVWKNHHYRNGNNQTARYPIQKQLKHPSNHFLDSTMHLPVQISLDVLQSFQKRFDIIPFPTEDGSLPNPRIIYRTGLGVTDNFRTPRQSRTGPTDDLDIGVSFFRLGKFRL